MRDYRRYMNPPPPRGAKGGAVVNRKKVEKPPRPPFPWKRVMRLLGRTLLVFSIAVSLAALLYGTRAFASRYVLMPVERCEIRGKLKHLTRDEILRLAGLRGGESIFSLNIRRMGENISQNPWVAHLRIRRYLPGTLILEVQERVPVAVVNLGYLYYLDQQGEIFKPLTAGEPMDFPIVTGIAESDLRQERAAVEERLRAVLTILGELGKSGAITLDEVSEIHYDRGNGFTIYALHGGVPVRLGHDDFAAKLARLGRIYRQLQAGSSPPLFIDLDYPDRIIVRRS